MRVDGFFPAAGPIQNSNGDTLSKLKIGDTVRAQVLENSGNELSLKLSDGSIVTANAMNPVEASDGEYVNFTFKGIVDGKPALEVLNQNIQPQIDAALENIKNTLVGLKLPITDKNIELAQALLKQNLPVTAENMAKATALLDKNMQLKPDEAAFLTAANMSDNKNIENLQNLLAGRLKISNDINELLKLIGKDFNNSSDSAKSTMVNNILEKLLTNIAAKGQNASVTGSANSSTQTNASAVPTTTTMSADGSTTTTNTANANQNTLAQNLENNSSKNAAMNNSVNNNVNQNTNNAKDNTLSSLQNNNTINNSAENLSEASKNVKELNNNINGQAKGEISSLKSDVLNNANLKGNTSEVEQQISNILKGGEPLNKADLPLLNKLSTQLESEINSGKMSADELSVAKLIAKEIDTTIVKLNSGEHALEQLNTNEKGIKNFEESVNKLQNMFIKIDQNSDEINPVKLYKSMQDAVQSLKASIQQLPTSMQQAASNIVSNLESNINFINQLNNYSSYLQIPLSIFNHNTTGELYMLKKGSKSKKLDPSNMTVLISLDSNNIGRIDTLLSVDKKNISTNFRLEDSKVFDILKENHKMLYTSLLEKGYRLVDFTYRLMEEPLSVVNFEEEAKKEFIKNPNSIDIVI